jgi:biopolymer transport protein ExbD
MAEKRRVLDVMLAETREAYRGVPYTVVVEWIQEGRLLGEDQVRAAGGATWYRLDSVPALAAFLPRAEPTRVDDRAEALEPVEVDFSWRRPPGMDEGDVDMIPLIDISLVLLIFFMMSAAVRAGVFSPINTPPAEHQLLKLSEDMYMVNVDAPDPAKKAAPFYSLSSSKQEIIKPPVTLAQLKSGLKDELAKQHGVEIKVGVRADENLPYEVIQNLILELQGVERDVNDRRDPGQRVKLFDFAVVSDRKR